MILILLLINVSLKVRYCMYVCVHTHIYIYILIHMYVCTYVLCSMYVCVLFNNIIYFSFIMCAYIRSWLYGNNNNTIIIESIYNIKNIFMNRIHIPCWTKLFFSTSSLHNKNNTFISRVYYMMHNTSYNIKIINNLA